MSVIETSAKEILTMKDIHQIINRQINMWNYDRIRLQKESVESKPLSEIKPVVTVSRQRGCRGHDFAEMLAKELNYGLFDQQIIDYVASDAGVSRDMVESLDEENRSILEVWFKGMLCDRIFDHDEYISRLIKTVKTSYLQGGVVLLGRGANFILSNTSAFHVRCVASVDVRISNLMIYESMNEKEAQREIEKTDHKRAVFVKRYFNQNIDDPLSYDLVINMNKTTVEQAIKIVMTGLRARGWSVAQTGGEKRSSN